MAAVANRRFFEELNSLSGKPVTVIDSTGKIWEGEFLGYDNNTLSVCLANVKAEKGTSHRVFISGANIARIVASSKPFNLEGLRERLERVFPNMIQSVPQAGVIIVMGKIRLNETGVIEGTGPAADKVKDIYTRYMSEAQQA
jgi:small nuclear ribonucleoprotein (snRNP)-like protein